VPLLKPGNGSDDGAPTCMPGDHFDVRMESPEAKIAVDRVLDLGNGIYEMIFYIRKRGIYSIEVDKVQTHDALLSNPIRVADRRLHPLGIIGANLTDFNPQPPPLRGTRGYPLNVDSFPSNPFNESWGVDTVPLPVPCDETEDWDRFRTGAWHRVGRCDGVHCIGPLLASMEGWVWVSDICIMRYFSFEDHLKILRNSWILAWGASTLQETLSNFIEYQLGRPIFAGTFMENLDSLKNTKKKPKHFSYRQYDIVPFNTTRITLAWGGCWEIAYVPGQCRHSQGVGTFRKLTYYVGPKATLKFDLGGLVPRSPQMILIDVNIWRPTPGSNEVVYFGRVDQVLHSLGLLLRSELPRPLVVYISGPVWSNSLQSWRTDGAFCQYFIDYHWHWVHEDRMRKHRDIVYIGRNQFTLPFHFGDEFVRLGMHYGSSRGICNTLHGQKLPGMRSCVRKTLVDDAMMNCWWNALVYHLRSAHNRTINF
jgi:hypothetical protein